MLFTRELITQSTADKTYPIFTVCLILSICLKYIPDSLLFLVDLQRSHTAYGTVTWIFYHANIPTSLYTFLKTEPLSSFLKCIVLKTQILTIETYKNKGKKVCYFWSFHVRGSLTNPHPWLIHIQVLLSGSHRVHILKFNIKLMRQLYKELDWKF